MCDKTATEWYLLSKYDLMKNTITFCLALIPTLLLAQVNPIDFEPAGAGADWTWTVFENDSNPALEIVANPFPTGINTSATVARFTALASGQPFAGCETMHGADIGTFTLSPENAFVSIMVYKTKISDVGIKFATFPGASTGELKIANTLVNQWERIVFDFTSIIDEPSSTDIDQLVVFPDFEARATDNVILFDNIVFGDSSLAVIDNTAVTRVTASPNPVLDTTRIQSTATVESLELYNVLGQKVKTLLPQSKDFALELSELKSGVYILNLTNAASSSQLRIVKL